MHRRILSLVSLLFTCALVTGCPPPANQQPTIAGTTATPTSVQAGATVTLGVEATDPDGDTLTYSWTQSPTSPAGTFTDRTTANPTWTAPQVTEDRSFEFTVTVTDGEGGSASGSVTVQVRAPAANRAPTISQGPQANPTSVTGSVELGLSVTASDPDGDALTYAWTQDPATPAGTFSSTSTANPIWTSPAVTSAQTFTLRVAISDGKGGSVQGTVQVAVGPPAPQNHAPTLTVGPTASSSSVSSGQVVNLSVTASDADGDALAYSWAQSPASPAGTFSNASAANPTWAAPTVTTNTSFQLAVTVSDGRGGTVSGTVTVTVLAPVNRNPTITQGPQASPSSVTGPAAVQLSVTASDPDGDSLTYSWQQTPVSPAGTFSTTSTANPTWNAPAVTTDTHFHLMVVVTDGHGGEAIASVTVTVLAPVNRNPTITQGPQASPTSVTGPAAVQLSVTASDPDGDTLTYSWAQSPTSPAGTFSNTSAANPTWNAPAVTTDTSFQLVVTVSDGHGGGASGTVTVNVLAPVNRNPTITQGPQASSNSVTGPAPVQLSVTASDPDGDSLTYAWTQEPTTPAGTFNSTSTANPTWTAPTVTTSQTFTLRVSISDGRGGSAQGTVQVTVAPPNPQNNPPTLTAGPTASATSVTSGQSVTLAVTASDPDGDSLTYSWTQNPVSPSGVFNDTAVANPAWTSPTVTTSTAFELLVTVSDGRGGTVSGSVTVTVLPPPNQSPSITQGPQASPASVMGPAPVQLSVTASDPDGDPLTYAWTQEPATPAGTFTSTTASNPTWTSPSVASTQTFTLRVSISDGRGGSAQGTVQVEVTPAPPQNNPPTLTGPTATPSTVDSQQATTLSVSATDPDGDPLTYAWTQTPATPAGTFTDAAVASPNWTAPRVLNDTTFQLGVAVSDGQGGSASGTVPVTVRAFVNRPPVLTGPTPSASTVNEQTTISLTSSASDPDGDPVTYAWTQVSPAAPVGTFSSSTAANPDWTAPDVNTTGVYRLRVTASDGQGGNTQGIADITVNKVNRSPVVGDNITGPTTLSAGDTGSFSITASDPDGDTLTYTWSQTVPVDAQGTFPIGRNALSTQWFSPAIGTQTSFTLSVSVTDGQSTPVVRTITLAVAVPRYTEVQSVWNAACTGCHGASGGLNLAAAVSHGQLVNVTSNACSPTVRVAPGNPDGSTLIRKMVGTACGSRMPRNNPTYFDANPGLVVRVRSWILGGAPNN